MDVNLQQVIPLPLEIEMGRVRAPFEDNLRTQTRRRSEHARYESTSARHEY